MYPAEPQINDARLGSRVAFPPVPRGWERHASRGWALTYGAPEGRGVKVGPRPVTVTTVTTAPDPITTPRPGAWANY